MVSSAENTMEKRYVKSRRFQDLRHGAACAGDTGQAATEGSRERVGRQPGHVWFVLIYDAHGLIFYFYITHVKGIQLLSKIQICRMIKSL